MARAITRGERGPYAGGRARREAILDAAVECLAEFGYHGMSLRDVARRVGISHPGVIYHFPNKEALFMSVIERHEQHVDLEGSLQGLGTSAERLEAFLSAVAEMGQSPMMVELECMAYAEAATPLHPAHEHYRIRRDIVARHLSRIFHDAATEGALKPTTLTTQEIADTVTSGWYGMQLTWLYNRTEAVEVMLRRLLLAYVDLPGQVN